MRDLSDYQEQYNNQPYEKKQAEFRKRKVVEVLNKNNHMRILEIGCGLESIFLEFNDYEKITVVEPANFFYEKALRDKKNTGNENISLINSHLEDAILELQYGEFDFVIVSCLLHEISNQDAFLRALYDISKSDTVIHISVPNANSFHRLLAKEMRLIKTEFEKSERNILLQQHTVFDIELLKSVVEKHGFTVIECGSYCFKPFTHQQMQNMIDSGLITEEILDGFYKMEKYLPSLGSEIYVNIKKI